MNQLKYRVLGLMSGTSLDGLDLCLADFWLEHNDWEFDIIFSETISYSTAMRNTLKQAYTASGSSLAEIDHEYGLYLADCVCQFIAKNAIDSIDLISSHGHTVYHDPVNKNTVQIGNGPELFQKTGIPVVCDFRVQDILLGGQGAPLVPIGDELLFGGFGACLNLGGFANISMKKAGTRIAFDICPVNIVLNTICEGLGLPYDDQGNIARQGTLNEDLLEKLNTLSFYSEAPPKSLGREWVEEHINPLITGYHSQTVLRTFVEHVAIQIATVLNKNLELNKNVVVTGGGAFNTFLMERITANTKTRATIILPDDELIEYKEALIFGLLGILRWTNQPNCLASVTGANSDHSSGRVYS